MSVYLVNKLVHHVNGTPEALEGYLDDPAGFVRRWEAGQSLRFTSAERQALIDGDYERLYAMGAHPFILWSFTQAIYERDRDRMELIADYKAKTAAIGYPEFRS